MSTSTECPPFPIDSALLGSVIKHGVPAIEDTEMQFEIAIEASRLAETPLDETLARLREFLVAASRRETLAA